MKNNSGIAVILRHYSKQPTNSYVPDTNQECMRGTNLCPIPWYRIEELLPDTVQMIHGPGCPVCVTHEDTISQAIEIARNPQTIFCTFGDMVRVPGTKGSLQQLKAEGKDIRIVYSPLDTLRIASENPEKQIVFFAIGFETTTPLYTLLLQEIVSRKITNHILADLLVHHTCR